MSERVAIVVGGGGELGRATAEKLAAAGFTVVGVDRSEEGLKELPDGIRHEAADPTDIGIFERNRAQSTMLVSNITTSGEKRPRPIDRKAPGVPGRSLTLYRLMPQAFPKELSS